MRILLLAPPGAGKGTQGERLAERYAVPHISVGDMLRDEVARQTELGRAIGDYLDKGELVPDDLIRELILDKVREAAERGGYVLDGFPRTLEQAEQARHIAEEEGIAAEVALHLTGDEEELVRRLLKRASEQGRADDTEEVIRQRLATYHEVTEPVVDFYRERGILVTVNGMPPMDQVTADILGALQRFERAGGR